MQQLTKTKCDIVKNAIVLTSRTPPDMDQVSQWSKELLHLLKLSYVDEEVSADLFVAAAKINMETGEEMIFLKVNYTIDDIWFELAKHDEKKFFKLFDHIESRLLVHQ
ncbi:hypothetical protein [Agaribacter marinus]|uniref:Uncharacterized protein n=1 Tax=Agaribacter marinus TaxID=1431249 RepID=A0AA37WFP9_9ALTE|nr:hypothetical protein [Agaribacter marinus]GLR69226.1 hypothetical protein GCM10007852_01340 [Agaribacter marinus]